MILGGGGQLELIPYLNPKYFAPTKAQDGALSVLHIFKLHLLTFTEYIIFCSFLDIVTISYPELVQHTDLL